MRVFVLRIIRALLLDNSLYTEVKLDKEALAEAILINIAYGIVIGIDLIGKLAVFPALMLGVLSAVLGWYFLAYAIFIIGTRLLPNPAENVELSQIVRVIGFVNCIGLIRIVAFSPLFRKNILIFLTIWTLAATIIAIKQVFNYSSTRRAVGVYLILFLIQAVIIRVLLLFVGGDLAGLSAVATSFN